MKRKLKTRKIKWRKEEKIGKEKIKKKNNIMKKIEREKKRKYNLENHLIEWNSNQIQIIRLSISGTL